MLERLRSELILVVGLERGAVAPRPSHSLVLPHPLWLLYLERGYAPVFLSTFGVKVERRPKNMRATVCTLEKGKLPPAAQLCSHDTLTGSVNN